MLAFSFVPLQSGSAASKRGGRFFCNIQWARRVGVVRNLEKKIRITSILIIIVYIVKLVCIFRKLS